MKKKEHTSTKDESLARNHEQADIHFGRILVTGIGLLALMLAGLLYSGLVEGVFSEMSPQPGAPTEVLIDSGTKKLPPEPRVEANPAASLFALREREDSVLVSYRWVSRDSGIVQVPVNRAMELVVGKDVLRSR